MLRQLGNTRNEYNESSSRLEGFSCQMVFLFLWFKVSCVTFVPYGTFMYKCILCLFAMQCSKLLCFYSFLSPFIYQVHAYVNLAYKSIVVFFTTKTVFFRVCFKVNLFWCMERISNCNKACPWKSATQVACDCMWIYV